MKPILTFLLLISSVSYGKGMCSYSSPKPYSESLIEAFLKNENQCRKQLKVAIIDTGLGVIGKGENLKLCDRGHKDFTDDGLHFKKAKTVDKVPLDLHGHGTNVAGLISDYAKDADYCLIILKFYQHKNNGNNQYNSNRALRHAYELNPDILNLSMGGSEKDDYEAMLIDKILNRGTIVVAAVGNDGQNLNASNVGYYPAGLDKRIVVVGALDKYNNRTPTSNYGDLVDFWELGENVTSLGIKMSGSSQATAIRTGKIIYEKSR